MVVKRRTGNFNIHFYQIGELLTKTICLVINDTKVYPSRLYGEKTDTKAKVEVLLLKEIKKDTWEVFNQTRQTHQKRNRYPLGTALNATC